MFVAAKRHTIERIKAAPIQADPFPHIVVENVFPADLYEAMQQRLPDDSCYRSLAAAGRVSSTYNAARNCIFKSDLKTLPEETREFWSSVFAAYRNSEMAECWLSVFGDQIRARMINGDMPERTNRSQFTTRSEILLMRDGPGYALPPHTDSPDKIVSALFYLPPDNSNEALGTALYRPKSGGFTHVGGPYLPRADFELVSTVPFRANTLLAFPKTSACFHGVEPVQDPTQRRDLMLFDLKFT